MMKKSKSKMSERTHEMKEGKKQKMKEMKKKCKC